MTPHLQPQRWTLRLYVEQIGQSWQKPLSIGPIGDGGTSKVVCCGSKPKLREFLIGKPRQQHSQLLRPDIFASGTARKRLGLGLDVREVGFVQIFHEISCRLLGHFRICSAAIIPT